MTSWRTNLGGALGALGTALTGIGTIGSISSLGSGQPVSQLLLWTNIGGFFISAAGKFFAALWSADAAVVKSVTLAQNDKIASIAGDTRILTKQVDKINNV